LKNSYFGVLASKNAKDVEIVCDDTEFLRVGEKDIDFDATSKLEEAYTLRASANEILNYANKEFEEIKKSASVEKEENIFTELDNLKTRKFSIDKDILETAKIIKECKKLEKDNSCILKLGSVASFVKTTFDNFEERTKDFGSLTIAYSKFANDKITEEITDLAGPILKEIKNIAFVWYGDIKPIIEQVKNAKDSNEKYQIILKSKNWISRNLEEIKQARSKFEDLIDNFEKASSIIKDFVKEAEKLEKIQKITAGMKR